MHYSNGVCVFVSKIFRINFHFEIKRKIEKVRSFWNLKFRLARTHREIDRERQTDTRTNNITI